MKLSSKAVMLIGVMLGGVLLFSSCRQPSRVVVYPYEPKPRDAEAEPPAIDKAAQTVDERPGTYEYEQEALKER